MTMVQLLRQLNQALLDSVDKSERMVFTEKHALITYEKVLKGHFVTYEELAALQTAVAHFLDKTKELI